jgi:hypothetical protein
MTYNRTDLQTYGRSVTLLDVLDRILDKGVVIIGDISVSIGDVELLSIKLKLLIASVETAEKMGIDFGWAGLRGKSDQKMMELEEKVKTLEAKQLVPARVRRR